jgi:hypothetical protein
MAAIRNSGMASPTWVALCGRHSVVDERVGTWGRAAAETDLERNRTSHPAVATRPAVCIISRKSIAAGSAAPNVESRNLAGRYQTRAAFAFCGSASSSCESRLLAQRTASGRVAVDRVAEPGSRTEQVLVIHSTWAYQAIRGGTNRPAPLDRGTAPFGHQEPIGRDAEGSVMMKAARPS